MSYANMQYINPGWNSDAPPPLSSSNLNDISNAIEAVNISQQDRAAIGAGVSDNLGSCLVKMGSGIQNNDIVISTRNMGSGWTQLNGMASAGVITGYPRPFIYYVYSGSYSGTYYENNIYQCTAKSSGPLEVTTGGVTYTHLIPNANTTPSTIFTTLYGLPYIYGSYTVTDSSRCYILPLSEAKTSNSMTRIFTSAGSSSKLSVIAEEPCHCYTSRNSGNTSTTISMQTRTSTGSTRSASMTFSGTYWNGMSCWVGEGNNGYFTVSTGNSSILYIRTESGFVQKNGTPFVSNGSVYRLVNGVIFDKNDNAVMTVGEDLGKVVYNGARFVYFDSYKCLDMQTKTVFGTPYVNNKCGDYGVVGQDSGIIYKFDGYPVVEGGWLRKK